MIADCGSATTRVVLLDVAQGQYRFIANGQAPTTAEPPWMDVTVGLLDAIGQIEAVTERKILSDKGRLLIPSQGASAGVDMFVAATSAAPPLRTVLVGLMDDVSLASARRVVLSTYATIEDVISLADSRTEEEQIDRLVELAPDVILVAGGTDGGAADRVLQLNETVSLALALMSGQARPPTVLYAGDAEPSHRRDVGGCGGAVDRRCAPAIRCRIRRTGPGRIAAIFERAACLICRAPKTSQPGRRRVGAFSQLLSPDDTHLADVLPRNYRRGRRQPFCDHQRGHQRATATHCSQ